MKHLNLLLVCFSMLRLSACGPSSPSDLKDALATHLVGGGKSDVTGPASGLATAGYAAPAKKTAGIAQRLWARAFVIAEQQAPNQRVALVTADLCYITGIVKNAVVEQLQAKYGDLYRHDNVLIAATHTHSGPGGFAQHGMYNSPTNGFSPENYEIIVEGIVNAIQHAHDSLQPGTIGLNYSNLEQANRNRSPEAFARNPESLRRELPNSTDESVTMIQLQGANKKVGIQHWFATHATSVDKYNDLISSDNKGYAALRLEELIRNTPGNSDFVAAFANSNAGDASPNVAGDVDQDGDWECAANENFACMRLLGERHLNSAQQLLAEPGKFIGSGIRSILYFVDMSKVTLDPHETGYSKTVTTCDPAIGLSMLAGSAEDGPGVGREGITCENAGPIFRQRCKLSRFACHGAKPVVLPTEPVGNYGFTPHIVPIQLIVIGKLALAGIPAEMTSMAGHLLKKSLLADLSHLGVERVVAATYANEYSNYIATRDEYQAQHYEGASTLFGEWTLHAYQKVLRNAAGAIVNMSGNTLGTPPKYSTAGLPIAEQRRGDDKVPEGSSFGAVVTDAGPLYRRGDRVAVTFQASNLNLSVGRGSLAYVQQQVESVWANRLDDDSFFTKVRWVDKNNGQSHVTIEWQIEPTTPRGMYRIVFNGRALPSVDLPAVEYQGVSRTFTIE